MKKKSDNMIKTVKSNSPETISRLQSNLSGNKLNNTSNNEDFISSNSKQNRPTTPDVRFSSKQNNRFLKFWSSTKSSKGFHKSKDFSPEAKNQKDLSLRNEFQMNVGKLNSNSTKEVAFTQLKDIILNNITEDALRIFISSLSSFDQNSTLQAKEIQALLYGFVANSFKENWMDPWDRPPNIIKTINRMWGHIRVWYLKENSYTIHKACSRSIIDIFDECMPKDNIKTVELLFIDPLFNIMISGVGKCSQEGAAICLSDWICHFGLNKNEWTTRILDNLDDKLISLVTKTSWDNPYIFEALYNLIQFIEFDKCTNYLKELYDRWLDIVNKKMVFVANGNSNNNSNNNTILMKTNSLNILKLIADKLKGLADISIGFFHPDVIKSITCSLKDKNQKIQIASNAALKSWKELELIYEEIKNKKEEIEPCDVYNKNDAQGVKKMDKLNYLRNLAKMAKVENKAIHIDYDTELPEKRKEDVYKKV